VAVHVVVDGFGSIKTTMANVRALFAGSAVQLEVFRPLDRWYAWLQPGQLRRLHQKLCVCDEAVAFVGGINVIDDRHDMHHGWQDTPRLDYAVPCAARWPCRAGHGAGHVGAGAPGAQLARRSPALARSRAAWRGARHAERSCAAAARGSVPRDGTAARCVRLFWCATTCASAVPSNAATSPPSATRARAWTSPCRTSTPGAASCVRCAAPRRRGVRVRLLLQGKIDYRIAALAAQALYDELRASGVRIFEYTPAFLHAKVAVVDDDWATVGSSNIDPLSLLLNLEANVVVRDAQFAQALAARFEAAFAVSAEVRPTSAPAGGAGCAAPWWPGAPASICVWPASPAATERPGRLQPGRHPFLRLGAALPACLQPLPVQPGWQQPLARGAGKTRAAAQPAGAGRCRCSSPPRPCAAASRGCLTNTT
jgi:cardiolipin synthase